MTGDAQVVGLSCAEVKHVVSEDRARYGVSFRGESDGNMGGWDILVYLTT